MLSMLSTILVTSLMVTLTTSLQCFSCDEGSRDASKKCSDIVVEQVEECPDSNYSCETKWENNGQLRKKGCWVSSLKTTFQLEAIRGASLGRGWFTVTAIRIPVTTISRLQPNPVTPWVEVDPYLARACLSSCLELSSSVSLISLVT